MNNRYTRRHLRGLRNAVPERNFNPIDFVIDSSTSHPQHPTNARLTERVSEIRGHVGMRVGVIVWRENASRRSAATWGMRWV